VEQSFDGSSVTDHQIAWRDPTTGDWHAPQTVQTTHLVTGADAQGSVWGVWSGLDNNKVIGLWAAPHTPQNGLGTPLQLWKSGGYEAPDKTKLSVSPNGSAAIAMSSAYFEGAAIYARVQAVPYHPN
jgi:hypothetical protein